ncbi:MAG: type II toxin-antitoxin system HicB family antitoxin [Desulfurococcales archaeon]|nr:type II toxin-antitoxin system HicB family antitoxin [Desulfurococcales archaeon]
MCFRFIFDNVLIALGEVIHEKERVYEFDVVILKVESGDYIALIPALPGCHTQGYTIDDVMRNVREAIELYLETLGDEEKRNCHIRGT